MSEHASCLYFIYLSFLHPSVLPEWFTDPFLVAWPAHNLLITLPGFATNHFGLDRHCICATSLFTILSSNMPTHVPFPWFLCHSSIPVYYKRLSRAIHPHNFSRPASTQFAYCITCLTISHFVSVWAHNCLSASSLVSHIHAHSLVWICLILFHVSCAPSHSEAQQSHPSTHF